MFRKDNEARRGEKNKNKTSSKKVKPSRRDAGEGCQKSEAGNMYCEREKRQLSEEECEQR